MRTKSSKLVLALTLGLVLVGLTPSAAAAKHSPSCLPPNDCAHLTWIQGYDDPATPNNLDRVGILKVGSPSARNVLVLAPGTSAGAAYFRPLADDIVSRTNGRWQVWSV